MMAVARAMATKGPLVEKIANGIMAYVKGEAKAGARTEPTLEGASKVGEDVAELCCI
jgi:hypothetical protein